MTERCLDLLRFGGVEAIPEQVDQCYGMTSARRWRGFWRYGLEDSKFCVGETPDCLSDTSGASIWLDEDGVQRARPNERFATHIYAIEFVGRRTLQAGKFGHIGTSDHEMVVDKLISLSKVR